MKILMLISWKLGLIAQGNIDFVPRLFVLFDNDPQALRLLTVHLENLRMAQPIDLNGLERAALPENVFFAQRALKHFF